MVNDSTLLLLRYFIYSHLSIAQSDNQSHKNHNNQYIRSAETISTIGSRRSDGIYFVRYRRYNIWCGTLRSNKKQVEKIEQIYEIFLLTFIQTYQTNQCRFHRFSVEVADFNFGETSSLDLEYKSFVRRLYDSIKEALPQRGQTAEINETDDSSLRYGVMT